MSYRNRMWLYAALSLGAAVGAGLVGSLLISRYSTGAGPWLVLILLLAASGVAIVATLPWWRQLDDVQRQGHLSSWYWGSMIGGLAFLMYLVATIGRHADLTKGAVYLLLAEFGGFVVLFGLWRLRGRGEAE